MDLYYRRRLPHWRQDEVTYFVTWRLSLCQPELDSHERDLIVAAMKRFDVQPYALVAYVVMNDHVHALVKPLATYELKDILHSWKSYPARQMQRETNRRGQVWQHEYFDRIVRNDNELVEKLNYIVRNPWKRWSDVDEYRWVWPLER